MNMKDPKLTAIQFNEITQYGAIWQIYEDTEESRKKFNLS
jgi:hypothetical protein